MRGLFLLILPGPGDIECSGCHACIGTYGKVLLRHGLAKTFSQGLEPGAQQASQMLSLLVLACRSIMLEVYQLGWIGGCCRPLRRQR